MQSARFETDRSALLLRLAFYTLLFLAFAPPVLEAQDRQAGAFIHQMEISGFPSINLFVSCTDKEGGSIPDVGEYNFQIEVDGKPAVIKGMALIRDLIAGPDNRVHIGLVIDNNDDLEFDAELLRRNAGAIIDLLRTGDDMMVVASDSAGTPVILSRLTPSPSILRDKVKNLQLSPRTRAYDLIGIAAGQLLRERPVGRRMVIVISPGDPRGRQYDDRDLADIGRYGILPVAVLQLGGRRVDSKYTDLAAATFGTVFHARDAAGVPLAMDEVRDWVNSQYQVALELPKAELKEERVRFKIKLNYLGVEYKTEFEPRLHPDYAAYAKMARAGLEGVSPIEDYSAFLEKFPKSRWADRVNLDLARIRLDNGDVAEANALLAKFKSTYPRSDLTDYAEYLLAEAYNRIRQTEAAESSFNTVVTDYPDGDWADDALFALGELYKGTGQQNKAFASYLALVDRYPASDLWDKTTLELALLYLDRDQTEEAIARLNALADRDVATPQTALALYHLGAIYAERGDAEQARNRLETYFHSDRLGPERLDALLLLADLYYDEDMYRRCAPLYRQIAEDPKAAEKAPEAFLKAGICHFNLKEYDQADELLGRLQTAYKGSTQAAEADAYLGLIAYDRKQWGRAAPLLARGADRAGNSDVSVDLWLKAGTAFINGSQWKEAVDPLEKIVHGYPNHPRTPEAKKQLASVYRAIGSGARGLVPGAPVPSPPPLSEAPARLTRQETRAARSEYDRAMKLFNSGDYDGAVPLFSSLLADYPASSLSDNAYYWIGQIAYNRKDYATAVEYFNMAVENRLSQAKDEDALLMLGKSYYNSNDMKRALEAFYRLLIMFPGGELERSAYGWARRIEARNPALRRDPEVAGLRRKLPPPPPLTPAQATRAQGRYLPLLQSGNAEEVETARFRLAEIDFAAENYDAALDRLRRIFEPGTPPTRDREATYLMGNCYYRLGMDDAANETFNKIINAKPGDAFARRSAAMLDRIRRGK